MLKICRAIYEYVSHRLHQRSTSLFKQGNQRVAFPKSPFIDRSSIGVGKTFDLVREADRPGGGMPLI